MCLYSLDFTDDFRLFLLERWSTFCQLVDSSLLLFKKFWCFQFHSLKLFKFHFEAISLRLSLHYLPRKGGSLFLENWADHLYLFCSNIQLILENLALIPMSFLDLFNFILFLKHFLLSLLYPLLANFSFPFDQVILVKLSYLFLKLLIVILHVGHLMLKINLGLC